MAVTPGWGGAERLLRVVGYSRALDLLLTGRVLNALEAEHIGLVDRVTTNGEALAAAQTFAEKLAHGPREAIRAIKALLRAHLSLSPDKARAAERAIFGQLWASPDHAEAARAFIEKRPPRFGGGASPEG
jgi:enoyl-CoA hydratase/carnithine racemase